MVWVLTSLDEKDLEKIQSLENKLGVSLLAFSEHDITLADISDKDLNEIKELEKELNISLIAVEKR